MKIAGQVNVPVEVPVSASEAYPDISDEVEVDVMFEGPGGQWRVPAFRADGGTFRARFAAPEPGVYFYRSESSSPDPGLNGVCGELEIGPYAGPAGLYSRGRLTVSSSRRTLKHRDGTPFFWLGDTWWMGLTSRLDWPDGFTALAADRVRKGFTLVQIVAGPLPDFDAVAATWHPQQANEAGWPWEPEWAGINPAYYDLADRRIACLVAQGLVPCLVGMWGYYLPFMGVERARRHWRNLVARYAAYPVVWCIAGEVNMPSYSTPPELWEARQAEQEAGWTEVTRYVRGLDPFHNPITAHPSFPDSRAMLQYESLLDIDMLQTGHGGYYSMAPTVKAVGDCVAMDPPMPVVNGEVSYEGIMGGSKDEVQRFMFWACITCGASGHTYGAQGIWAMSSREEPFEGTTTSWGDGFWQDVMHLPGSAQVGLGRRLLERYPWWAFAPRQEPQLPLGRASAFATGIPGVVALYYLPISCVEPAMLGMLTDSIGIAPVAVEPGADYQAYFVNPRTGAEIAIGAVERDDAGFWQPPRKPSREDWLLVLADDGALTAAPLRD